MEKNLSIIDKDYTFFHQVAGKIGKGCFNLLQVAAKSPDNESTSILLYLKFRSITPQAVEQFSNEGEAITPQLGDQIPTIEEIEAQLNNQMKSVL